MIVKDTTTFCILFLQCKNQTVNGSVYDNKSLKPIKVFKLNFSTFSGTLFAPLNYAESTPPGLENLCQQTGFCVANRGVVVVVHC